MEVVYYKMVRYDSGGIMSKQFIVIVLVIVLGLFGVLLFTRDKDSTGQTGADSSVQATNHTIGAGEKNVTILEYGDFQCPACKAYYPLIQEIKKEYGDKIKFQFRHYPLTQIHPNAFIASRAAEAAGLQSKFFEMHDMLYEQQDSWSSGTDPTATFVTFATQLGLNVDKFKTDMGSKSVADLINADLKAGQGAGVNSTPSFVINNKKVEKNPQTIEEFKKLIDDEIAKAGN